MNDFDKAIEDANEVLKHGLVRCRIIRKGDRLSLRGTFPPKPGTGKSRPHQQRIPLGVSASSAGLRTAIATAREVGLALDKGTFCWDDYLEGKPENINDWITRLERDYFRDKQRTLTNQKTWRKDYQAVYERYADLESEVSIPALRYFIRSYSEPNSSLRRRYVYACRKLAIAVGLDGSELDGLLGKYERKREIPTLPDQLIAETYYKIPTASWQWVYGMIATYGLRNHEIFHCHLDDYPLCRVLEGKTGARWALPVFLEWADQWRLVEIQRPKCTGRALDDFGARVSSRFGEYRRKGILDFRAKDLRTAYGVRLARCQVNTSVGAKSMGHSNRVHTETYHVAYGKNDALEQLMLLQQRGDRPQPPILDIK